MGYRLNHYDSLSRHTQCPMIVLSILTENKPFCTRATYTKALRRQVVKKEGKPHKIEEYRRLQK
jgi:hypothetical protein